MPVPGRAEKPATPWLLASARSLHATGAAVGIGALRLAAERGRTTRTRILELVVP